MQKLKVKEVFDYVEKNIGSFHEKRLHSLENLQLKKILKKKNPYLFKAKATVTSEQYVRNLLNAHLSSQEETIFGDFLEGLAIHVCERVYNGRKSSTEGIDMEFDAYGVRNIVSIKSGPNWGNSRQVSKMKEDFTRAKKILRTSGSATENIVAVNGCCYGRDNKPDKGIYFKYCGQKFWEYISGEDSLYIGIIEPLGHNARRWNDDFALSYSKVINLFTKEFNNEYCIDGMINWPKIVELTSSKKLKT